MDIDKANVISITFEKTKPMGFDVTNANVEDDDTLPMLAYYKNLGDDTYDLAFVTKFVAQLPANCTSLFSNFTNLTTVKFNGVVDTSNITNSTSMFSGCSALKYLDMSTCDLSNLATTTSMFSGCTNLEAIKTPKTLGTSISLVKSLKEETDLSTSKNLISTTDTNKTLKANFEGAYLYQYWYDVLGISQSKVRSVFFNTSKPVGYSDTNSANVSSYLYDYENEDGDTVDGCGEFIGDWSM